MSLPPATILVKRKATDEPVDFLRVHEANGKRQRRATDFVFSRQQPPNASDNANTPSSAPQSVRRIKAIHRSVSSQQLAGKTSLVQSNDTNKVKPPALGGTVDTNVSTCSKTENQPVKHDNNVKNGQQSQEPRRFHMSRPMVNPSPSQNSTFTSGRKRSAKTETVFVERRVRPKLSGDGRAGSVAPDKDVLPQPFVSQNETQLRPQKRPGLAARRPVSRDPPPVKDVAKPVSESFPAQTRLPLPQAYSDDFVAQMQAYTLQEIGHSIAESETFNKKPAPALTTPRKTHNPKFTPKKPALRYHERHPEQFVTPTASQVEVDAQGSDQEDADDDSEYIIDTYIRIPADSMEIEDDEQSKDFGLLILDSQPDIDEFYREDEDSEEEEEDEEEDENAENHYSADYPDEEVDSDDEYGRNAYNYRNHNASDLEEFDQDDANFSDEDSDATKYPWMKKSSWTSKDFAGDELMEDA